MIMHLLTLKAGNLLFIECHSLRFPGIHARIVTLALVLFLVINSRWDRNGCIDIVHSARH